MLRMKSIGIVGGVMVLLGGCGSKSQPKPTDPPKYYKDHCVCTVQWSAAASQYLDISTSQSTITINACLDTPDDYSGATTLCTQTVKGFVEAEIQSVIAAKSGAAGEFVCAHPESILSGVNCELVAYDNQTATSAQFPEVGVKTEPACSLLYGQATKVTECRYAETVEGGQTLPKNCDVALDPQTQFANRCNCNTVQGCSETKWTVRRPGVGNADDPPPVYTGNVEQSPITDLIAGRRDGTVSAAQSSMTVTVTAEMCVDLLVGEICESVSDTRSGSLSGGFRLYGGPCPGASCPVILEADMKGTNLNFSFSIAGIEVASHSISNLILFTATGETPIMVDATGHAVVPAGALQYRSFWKDNGEDYENIANLQQPVDLYIDWANRTVSIPSAPISIGGASGTLSFQGTFPLSLLESTGGLCPKPTFAPVSRAVVAMCTADSALQLQAPALATSCADVQTTVAGQIIAVNDSPLSTPINIVNGQAQVPHGKLLVRWTVTDSRGMTDTVDQIIDAVPRPALAAATLLDIGDRTVVRELSGTGAAVASSGSGTSTFGPDARVGEVDSLGAVVLRDRAAVSGSIISPVTPTLLNGATMGTYVAQAPGVVTAPELPAAVAGTTVVDLQPDSSQSLAPGAYAAVTVKSRAKLVLVAGDYSFDSFDLEPEAHLVLDKTAGPIRIVVRRNVILRGAFDHTPSAESGFVLGYLGGETLYVESPFRGTIVAPSATINLRALNGGTHNGEFFGASIRTEAGATVVHVPSSCGN